MNDYTAATYGDKIADVYDEMYPLRADVGATVDALAKLAGDRPALETRHRHGQGRVTPCGARRRSSRHRRLRIYRRPDARQARRATQSR